MMSAIVWIFCLVVYIATLNAKTLRFFLTACVSSSLWLIVILVRNQGDYFVYLIPPCRIIISVIFFWGIISKEEQLDGVCDYKAVAPLIIEELYMSKCFLLESIFFSPSLKMMTLTFMPIYIISQYIHAQMTLEPGDGASLTIKIGLAVLLLLIDFAIYYLVTIHDL